MKRPQVLSHTTSYINGHRRLHRHHLLSHSCELWGGMTVASPGQSCFRRDEGSDGVRHEFRIGLSWSISMCRSEGKARPTEAKGVWDTVKYLNSAASIAAKTLLDHWTFLAYPSVQAASGPDAEQTSSLIVLVLLSCEPVQIWLPDVIHFRFGQ